MLFSILYSEILSEFKNSDFKFQLVMRNKMLTVVTLLNLWILSFKSWLIILVIGIISSYSSSGTSASHYKVYILYSSNSSLVLYTLELYIKYFIRYITIT